jgi:hypothetical protein
MSKSNTKANFGISIFLFLLAVTLLVISFWRQSDTGRKAPQFPDYEAYKSFHKKVTLVSDHTSFVTTDSKKVGKIKEQLSLKGKFSRAYIFISVSVDNGKPLTVYDSIYIKLNRIGGHILRNKSLPLPASDITQLLYDMRQIPYIKNVPYSETKKPLIANWLAALNSNETISFDSFLSSARPGGLIKEITVAFECEEKNVCDITLPQKKEGSKAK